MLGLEVRQQTGGQTPARGQKEDQDDLHVPRDQPALPAGGDGAGGLALQARLLPP